MVVQLGNHRVNDGGKDEAAHSRAPCRLNQKPTDSLGLTVGIDGCDVINTVHTDDRPIDAVRITQVADCVLRGAARDGPGSPPLVAHEGAHAHAALGPHRDGKARVSTRNSGDENTGIRFSHDPLLHQFTNHRRWAS